MQVCVRARARQVLELQLPAHDSRLLRLPLRSSLSQRLSHCGRKHTTRKLPASDVAVKSIHAFCAGRCSRTWRHQRGRRWRNCSARWRRWRARRNASVSHELSHSRARFPNAASRFVKYSWTVSRVTWIVLRFCVLCILGRVGQTRCERVSVLWRPHDQVKGKISYRTFTRSVRGIVSLLHPILETSIEISPATWASSEKRATIGCDDSRVTPASAPDVL